MNSEATASDLESILEFHGVTRRSFMKLCGAVVAAAGVSGLTVPRVAQALEQSVIGAKEGNLYPVIWLEGASCTGCTESFAQLRNPDPASLILEMISLNYNDVLSAGAGESLEEAKSQTIAAGNYILVYEGGVLRGWDGYATRIGGRPSTEILTEAAKDANAVVALGSCAVNGGWMSAHPNRADACGVQQYLKQSGISTPVINVPGCPANPEWLVSILVNVVVMNSLPALNSENKPASMFDQTIHDLCPRRGHFENGEFVRQYGTKEEEEHYCLYTMGCRGPQTKALCPITLYNDRRSWCIEAGAPCIGCCEANPNDPGDNWVEVNAPFADRHRKLCIGDWQFQPQALCLALTGIVAVALVIHGFGMKKSGRLDGNVRFESKRRWDAKHPDRSIGDYDEDLTIIHEDGTKETVPAGTTLPGVPESDEAWKKQHAAQQAAKKADKKGGRN